MKNCVHETRKNEKLLIRNFNSSLKNRVFQHQYQRQVKMDHYQNYRRVTEESQTSTDKSQTSTDESQTSTDGSQKTTDELQTTTDEPQKTTDESQTSHRRLKKILWRMQLSRRLLHATRITEVYFQSLTWFNKFICRPSDICCYAIWFAYETSK